MLPHKRPFLELVELKVFWTGCEQHQDQKNKTLVFQLNVYEKSGEKAIIFRRFPECTPINKKRRFLRFIMIPSSLLIIWSNYA
jgi:hypothetical protein